MFVYLNTLTDINILKQILETAVLKYLFSEVIKLRQRRVLCFTKLFLTILDNAITCRRLIGYFQRLIKFSVGNYILSCSYLRFYGTEHDRFKYKGSVT